MNIIKIMRAITLTLISFFITISIVNANPAIEFAEIQRLVNSDKSGHKNILIKVFDINRETSFDSVSFSDNFIETSLYTTNIAEAEVINNYKINTFPSIILLNSEGNLILPVKKVNSSAEIKEYVAKALKIKEQKPIAQWDMEYRDNKLNKNTVFDYIVKRTNLGFDNCEQIDTYTSLVSKKELLNKNTLTLFFANNNVNIPGLFFSFVEQNQEEIKQILKLSDDRFYRLVDKSIEHCFDKICCDHDEALLNHIINARINTFYLENAENKDIIYNEYMTRYYHATYQPLKLANHASAYVNAIFKHKEDKENENNSKNRGLYLPRFTNPISQVTYAVKLRNAAQYVVETISSKSMLNNALAWSVTAEQMAGDNYGVYETQAYILYKLGKKNEAITNMEKAFRLIPQNNITQRETIGFNLIKMKRGERIY